MPLTEAFLEASAPSESLLDVDALRFKLPFPLTGVTDGLAADEPFRTDFLFAVGFSSSESLLLLLDEAAFFL